jgi:hypothetical protein
MYPWGKGSCSNCKHHWDKHRTNDSKVTTCMVKNCQCRWVGSRAVS